MDRPEQEGIIREAIDTSFRVFEMSKKKIEEAKELVSTGTDLQIEIIAEAISSDPKEFVGSLINGIIADNVIAPTACLATVYSPELHKERSRNFRKRRIDDALMEYLAADMTVPPRFYGPEVKEFECWEIFAEDEVKRIRAKRFVAMECALYYCFVSDSTKQKLRDRTVDDSRTDHEQLLAILRKHNDREITLGQIDFILAGGAQAISEGAL